MDENYRELLQRSAKTWGVAITPEMKDDAKAYPKPDILEVLHWEDSTKRNRVDVSLFVFNGQWGYCMSAYFSRGGFGYGPFLKFCDPYPSRSAALRSALEKLRRYDIREPGAITWLEQILAPVQLSLF